MAELQGMERRAFLTYGVAGLALVAAGSARAEMAGVAAEQGLSPLPGRPAGIAGLEYLARIAKAQALMRQQGLAALIVEPGSSLVYFTGVHWRRSERLTCAIIPAQGGIALVTPFFEEPSVRETLAVPADVRTWLEDENPLAKVAGFLAERGLASAAIGTEETNRYFIIDGLQKALPTVTVKNGAGVVRGCRMIKSASEIALMQYATDITIAAYRHTIARIREGMRHVDVQAIMKDATERLGGRSEFEDALIGESAAYPHGSDKPQIVKAGEIILMDCGCTVDGYQSDVSRTFVFGTPTARQRKVWNDVKGGQQVAFRAARVGVTAGSVDDAVRAYYEKLGYGPGYRLPGLSHRTGHGIGLDGHEPINLVRGEGGVLQPGMCFSNEPGLYIPGEFGVRMEDCFYMTETGPRWFSTPSVSIEQPV
ncbi:MULTISPECIES: M24 family metallopeptidase [unclassified Sphingomonas]|uniref:M24 family metallopeptidase n=1 Tax=unclassified Sphingomonas TaxID=196159 RepID=UPI000ADACF1C|nr:MULTISPECIES: Xaa-Pro peptidase family protein [unclassified Sphingomonas]